MINDKLDSETITKNISEILEEDNHGLYELIWMLNRVYPNISEESKIKSCIPIVSEMIKNGTAELLRQKWAKDQSEKILSEESLRIIYENKSWKKPLEINDGIYYVLSRI